MAFEEYDKYEQSELVQKWLRENGLSIVVGVAIGLVGIFGWQQWRNHQARNESDGVATLSSRHRLHRCLANPTSPHSSPIS